MGFCYCSWLAGRLIWLRKQKWILKRAQCCLPAATSAVDSGLRWVGNRRYWKTWQRLLVVPGRQTEDVHSVCPEPQTSFKPAISASIWVVFGAGAELCLAATCWQHQPSHGSPLGNGRCRPCERLRLVPVAETETTAELTALPELL